MNKTPRIIRAEKAHERNCRIHKKLRLTESTHWGMYRSWVGTNHEDFMRVGRLVVRTSSELWNAREAVRCPLVRLKD